MHNEEKFVALLMVIVIGFFAFWAGKNNGIAEAAKMPAEAEITLPNQKAIMLTKPVKITDFSRINISVGTVQVDGEVYIVFESTGGLVVIKKEIIHDESM